MKQLRFVIVLGLVVLLPTLAFAGEIFEKVGTVGAQFLKIGVGARAVGMGEAFVPIADDGSAIYWNPGGIARITQSEIVLDASTYPADIRHYFAGYVFSYRWFPGVLAVSSTVLAMPPMDVTTPYKPDGTGETFDSGSMCFGITYARSLTDRFSFGATLKWINLGLEDESTNNILVDFGTLYDTGYRTIRIGVVVQHIGPNVEFVSGGKETPMPTTFKVGMSMQLFESDVHGLLSAFEFNHPSDNAERANIGLEYSFRRYLPTLLLAVRGGYRLNRDEEGLTGGFGVRFPTSKTSAMRVDYAYSEFGRLGGCHRITIDHMH